MESFKIFPGQNYNYGNYSTVLELFLFWIAECFAEKELKKLETSTMNIIRLGELDVYLYIFVFLYKSNKKVTCYIKHVTSNSNMLLFKICKK